MNNMCERLTTSEDYGIPCLSSLSEDCSVHEELELILSPKTHGATTERPSAKRHITSIENFEVSPNSVLHEFSFVEGYREPHIIKCYDIINTSDDRVCMDKDCSTHLTTPCLTSVCHEVPPTLKGRQAREKRYPHTVESPLSVDHVSVFDLVDGESKTARSNQDVMKMCKKQLNTCVKLSPRPRPRSWVSIPVNVETNQSRSESPRKKSLMSHLCMPQF